MYFRIYESLPEAIRDWHSMYLTMSRATRISHHSGLALGLLADCAGAPLYQPAPNLLFMPDAEAVCHANFALRAERSAPHNKAG